MIYLKEYKLYIKDLKKLFLFYFWDRRGCFFYI